MTLTRNNLAYHPKDRKGQKEGVCAYTQKNTKIPASSTKLSQYMIHFFPSLFSAACSPRSRRRCRSAVFCHPLCPRTRALRCPWCPSSLSGTVTAEASRGGEKENESNPLNKRVQCQMKTIYCRWQHSSKKVCITFSREGESISMWATRCPTVASGGAARLPQPPPSSQLVNS